MLKVVVFDSGYGGEFFADLLGQFYPMLDITRVIEWRDAVQFLNNPRKARKLSQQALSPYIGKVDLIVLANHLLSATSLKYFRRKFKNQQFVGFHLKQPDTFLQRNALIITTKAVTKTLEYRHYILKTKRKFTVITPDSWSIKIDEGTLTREEIIRTIYTKCHPDNIPGEIVLACSQFHDIKPVLKQIFGPSVRIYDSFTDAVRDTAKALRIRGGIPKQK